MNEIQLIAIGALITLVSGVIIQSVMHLFSSRRDKNNWKRDNIRREKEYLKQKEEKLKAELSESMSKVSEFERSILDYLTYGIVLMNQRRDILLGFNDDEQLARADELRDILSKFNKEELTAIAEEKKPLPELQGKPKSLLKL